MAGERLPLTSLFCQRTGDCLDSPVSVSLKLLALSVLYPNCLLSLVFGIVSGDRSAHDTEPKCLSEDQSCGSANYSCPKLSSVQVALPVKSFLGAFHSNSLDFRALISCVFVLHLGSGCPCVLLALSETPFNKERKATLPKHCHFGDCSGRHFTGITESPVWDLPYTHLSALTRCD